MRALSTLAALAGAGLLLWGVPGSGYVVAWPALATAKRDVKVYDNFGDAQANDDTTPDARWPGWTGAARAIWKGAAEWGSRRHATGGGDPTQPDGIGSGGANLDPLFLGLAPGVGAPNDDVASELNGSNAAVIAFTELPPNDGWRVRFYANPWILDDDSAGPAAGAVDLHDGEQLQADCEWQVNFKRHREILPDVDHRLPDVGPSNCHNILAWRDHLSDFCAHRGNDAGEIGLDLCIAPLLDRLDQVGLCVRHRCFGMDLGGVEDLDAEHGLFAQDQ